MLSSKNKSITFSFLVTVLIQLADLIAQNTNRFFNLIMEIMDKMNALQIIKILIRWVFYWPD